MDVLSSVANLNTPLQPKANNSVGNGMKPQSSDKNNQNNEFSSYMKEPKNENKASNTEAAKSTTQSNKEQAPKENQKNNYNVKANSESNDSNVASNNKKNKKTEDQVENGVTHNSEVEDNSRAIKTLSEHINKIEKSKQEYVDPLTRRAAIQAFVSEMKSKFDIEPTQIVQSFSKLSVEELGLPPQQTMDKVIGQLPLQDSEKQDAQMFFTKMLDKTEASSMSEYLKTSDREYSLKALSDEQIKKEQLDKSLVKLSESFFTPSKPAQSTTEHVISKNAPSQLNIMQQNAVKTDWMKTADVDVSKNIDAPIDFNNKFGINSDYKNIYSQNLQNTNSDLSNYSALDQQSLGELSKNVEMSEADVGIKKAEPQILDLNKLAIDRQLQTKQVQTKADTSSDMESFSQDTLEPQIDISKSVNSGAQVQKGQETQTFQNIIQQQTVTDADVEQNINKIIQNSQTMIKDGGGEMKIQMNPEGLGEVNLKVLVEDGNVNIEMIAENKDVKKLMEKGLLDLKANLATHKLNVDGIKIDVADQLQNQLNQEFQDQEREFARQFMQDFRQSNQGFREQFFTGNGPNFKSQTEDEADNDYLRTQSSEKKSNSNRRLDLVA